MNVEKYWDESINLCHTLYLVQPEVVDQTWLNIKCPHRFLNPLNREQGHWH